MVVYDSGDSDALMNALQANLKGASKVFGRLSKGSGHLVDAVNSGKLKGAAYNAGSLMFVAYIDPMVQKFNEAVEDIQNDLNAYRTSDGQIRAIDTHIDGDLVQKQLDNTNHMIDVVQQKIKTDQDKLNSMGTAGSSAQDAKALGTDYGKLQKQLHNLQKLKTEYDEELAALRAFADDTAPLFKDSSQAFKDAMRGVKAINSTRANADGSIIFPTGVNMSWLDALRGDKLKSGLDPNTLPVSYRVKVTEIQDDPNLKPEDKAQKIEQFYEDWLHSLAPSAFDEYAEARRKYDKAKEEYEKKYGKNKYHRLADDPDVIAADKKLSKVLHNTHVNIRVAAQGLGDDVAKISSKNDLTEFYNMVQTGHPLDLKSHTYGRDNYSIWSRGWDGNPQDEKNKGYPSPDFLGNYLYGYYGSSVGIGSGMLHTGAGGAQVMSDLGRFQLNFHGDNPGDSSDIDEGIEDYGKAQDKKRH
ncbi:polymorphic toxin type 44 domain-containing protein [Bifidobacterium sp. ESL0798]|uniref:polymorphic toxin type 44 domain-containing protein n=1 Tax=Bifidobacterium sp. ESL0798 TaxID=2983235 RepID=UPI0023F82572|nr:polymorphic toxin type 44 domain-containing protein [Bifidobacterium sp. ESL0798]WEV74436.1 polymorphic toxin type 44 domain-containing protein [Bifidobacterium sp. ESL0798]